MKVNKVEAADMIFNLLLDYEQVVVKFEPGEVIKVNKFEVDRVMSLIKNFSDLGVVEVTEEDDVSTFNFIK